MIYRISCDRWGRFFTVPCSVVDDYIKLSDGEFVKVLLCILCSNSNIADTELLAGQAGVSEQTAHDAVIYWAGRGVISAESDNGISVKSSEAAVKAPTVSRAVTAPVSAAEAIDPGRNTSAVRSLVKYSPKELAEIAEKNQDIKMLINDIQKTLCRTINATETAGLINLYEYYGFSAASILMIAEYCHQLGKDRFAYIETVAKNWFERGIVSYSDIEAEIIRQSRIKSYQNKAAKVLGLESKPSKRQREYIDKWNEMGFSTQMLAIAYEKCMDSKNKLSFGYIDGILKNWAGKSIMSPEQVADDDKRFSQSAVKKYGGDKNKETSYDLDEWEQFAMNYNPNSRGGKE